MVVNNIYSTYKQKFYPFGFRHDALTLTRSTFSFIISYVLSTWMITTVSLMFVARLGQRELNGSGLAFTVAGLVSESILIGLNYGCDTLLPQCFGGNKRKMGIILQRSIIIAFYACFIIWTLLLNAVSSINCLQTDQCLRF